MTHPAAADGERLHPGAIAQPVNTASSLGYLAAAWWLYRRTPAAERSRARTALAAAVAANGLGSMGFHGPGDRVSKAVHDASLWTIVALLAGDLGTTLLREPGQLRRRIGPLGLLAAGGVLNRMTRTGGPWHRPDSVLQGHAGWHLLSALAVASWPIPGPRGPGRGRP